MVGDRPTVPWRRTALSTRPSDANSPRVARRDGERRSSPRARSAEERTPLRRVPRCSVDDSAPTHLGQRGKAGVLPPSLLGWARFMHIYIFLFFFLQVFVHPGRQLWCGPGRKGTDRRPAGGAPGLRPPQIEAPDGHSPESSAESDLDAFAGRRWVRFFLTDFPTSWSARLCGSSEKRQHTVSPRARPGDRSSGANSSCEH